MERRLKLLASRSVRNIDQYNKLFENQTPSLFESDEEQPLPHIIIIIDELADLMMLDKANVEEAITRLAQMARAVGIHLVLATQRPSETDHRPDQGQRAHPDLLPSGHESGLANHPGLEWSRSPSGTRRHALPATGNLPPAAAARSLCHRKGDRSRGRFLERPGSGRVRARLPRVPRDEKGRDLDAEPEDGDGNDELFEDAVRLVLEFGKASTSLLQRRLRIGYGRAAHLIDMMERDGIVGPADGSKPREILKPPDWLNQIEPALR